MSYRSGSHLPSLEPWVYKEDVITNVAHRHSPEAINGKERTKYYTFMLFLRSCSSVWIEHLRPNDMEVNRARRRFCDDDYVGIKITTFEERIIRESRGSRVRTALFKKALAENQRVKGFENRVGSATPFLRKKSCTKRREKLYQKKRKAVPKEEKSCTKRSEIYE